MARYHPPVTLDREAIDRSIGWLRQALAALPPEHPDRADLHANLGVALRQRYDLTGDLADLDAAITHLDEAVAVTPADHPDRARRLIRLGDALIARYQRTQNEADLDAGVARLREGGVSGEELRQRIRQSGGRTLIVGDFSDWVERSAPPPVAAPSERWPAPPSPEPGWARPADPGGAPPWVRREPPVPEPPDAGGPPPDPGGPPVTAGPPDAGGPPADTGAYGRLEPPGPVAPQPLPTDEWPRAADQWPPPAPQPTADTRRLEFAAAYRRRVEGGRRHPLLFYVHRPHAREMVWTLIDLRAPQLGGAPEVSHGAAVQAVESGTTITIVPNVVGATFEPGRIDVIVDDAVRELTFQMSVPADAPPGPLGGYIDVFVGPLIIGQVPVEFEVHRPGPTGVPAPSEGEQFLTVANASIFDKIFISYSRRDAKIVDMCIATYQGLGVRVLVDRLDLRSGDHWRARLESMIRESDIFQLYWSQAAAASAEVHHEWRLALALSQTRDRFIRPLYWEKPMPTPPEALNHLHFSHLDLKLLRRAVKAHQPRQRGFLRRMLATVRGAPA